MRTWYLACGMLLLANSHTGALAVTFDNVVSLGDSLLDDPDGQRSPVSAEHLAERLGAPLTKFAKSGSTSRDLIRDGQHLRAADAFGEGDLAILWVGGNDFFRHTLGITLGLYGFLDDLESNVGATLSTLRADGMEVVVFNLPDLSNIPLTDSIANFRKATERWNVRLDALAETYGATVVDVFDLFEQFAHHPTDFSLLGNVPILESPPIFGGECPLCVFADLLHPSAFAQGYIANQAIAAINQAYDPAGTMPLAELSRVEIALLAGLHPGDFNGNQIVDPADLIQWKSDYGSFGADADSDGDTDGNDFLVWQQQLAPISTSASATVPEPASCFLLAISVVAAMISAPRFRAL